MTPPESYPSHELSPISKERKFSNQSFGDSSPERYPGGSISTMMMAQKNGDLPGSKTSNSNETSRSDISGLTATEDPFATPLHNKQRSSIPVNHPTDPNDATARPESGILDNDPTARRTSVSFPMSDNAPSAGMKGESVGEIGGLSMVRKGSTKRKPVPSLGPELRREIGSGRKKGVAGSTGEAGSGGGKKEFKLIPDLPA